MPESIHYDRIVHLERLQRCLKEYFTTIGLRTAFGESIDRLPVKNPSAVRTGMLTLNPDQLLRIYRIYRDDFELLGYAARTNRQNSDQLRAA